MDITIANTPDPEPCPTCSTVTSRQYQLDPHDGNIDEYRVCEVCVGDELNSYNDALYGKREWYNDGYTEVSETVLVQIIEAEFVRTTGGLRWDSRVLEEGNHLKQVERLVEKDHLDTGTMGVDEAKSFRPTPERRLELIQTYDLMSEWDTTMQRRQHLKDELKEEFGDDISFS